MQHADKRAEHLGWVEAALQAANPALSHFRISAQSHYGPPDRLAFVDVFGLEGDRTRRRQIRAEASDMLRRLGYVVELEPGRDIYDVTPLRPTSAHDQMRMLNCLRAALDRHIQI
ncbi:MAG: hypothetical protein KDK29_19255 [Sedimentitalea sp.]|nr:hypothetical protein [Sedimentitalea sp.]